MMHLDLCTVGGYNEVGRNMAAVKVNDTAVLLDMGFYMQKIMEFEEEGGHAAGLSGDRMIKLGIVPDVHVIDAWKSSVRAIALTHCHFDHIGAVPYLAPFYPQAPVYGTPFTMAVVRKMMHDEDMFISNPLKTARYNTRIKLSADVEMEYIYVTHSTPQASIVVLHTPKGAVVYATDFKLDDHPVLGKAPDYEALNRLADEKVLALIVDSLYSAAAMKTPSEKVAREMLRETMLETDNDGCAIVGTCFASHLARLKSFADFGRTLRRKVVFMGRSMQRYVEAAVELGLVDFPGVELVSYGRDVKRRLHDIEKRGSEDYAIVCTGGQGERNSVLARMLRKDYPFQFYTDDQVIFSNKVIPVEPNITNRALIEDELRKKGVRVYKDVHVSGHDSREDIRWLIEKLEPEHVIPCHGPPNLLEPACDLAEEMGYTYGKTAHLLGNGGKLKLHY